MDPPNSIPMEDQLQAIRDLPDANLAAACSDLIPADLMPSSLYLQSLTPTEAFIVYRSCMLLYLVTNKSLVPRQFQLEATVAMMSGRDSLINAGTGTGKTICMVLPQLLDPDAISIVVSPLKRLQMNQVSSKTMEALFWTWIHRGLLSSLNSEGCRIHSTWHTYDCNK